jgi:anthranilate phosphoribosyltransferase
VLAGDAGPVRDIVALNTAAGLEAFDLASHPERHSQPLRERLVEKISVAQAAIDDGRAQAKFTEWVNATQAAG